LSQNHSDDYSLACTGSPRCCTRPLARRVIEHVAETGRLSSSCIKFGECKRVLGLLGAGSTSRRSAYLSRYHAYHPLFWGQKPSTRPTVHRDGTRRLPITSCRWLQPRSSDAWHFVCARAWHRSRYRVWPFLSLHMTIGQASSLTCIDLLHLLDEE